MQDDNEDIGEDDQEDMSLSGDDPSLASDEDEDSSNDIGESAGVGRRGGRLTTSGSFVMTSPGANRAGNDEEE